MNRLTMANTDATLAAAAREEWNANDVSSAVAAPTRLRKAGTASAMARPPSPSVMDLLACAIGECAVVGRAGAPDGRRRHFGKNRSRVFDRDQSRRSGVAKSAAKPAV